jgi:hypothetical protein
VEEDFSPWERTKQLRCNGDEQKAWALLQVTPSLSGYTALRVSSSLLWCESVNQVMRDYMLQKPASFSPFSRHHVTNHQKSQRKSKKGYRLCIKRKEPVASDQLETALSLFLQSFIHTREECQTKSQCMPFTNIITLFEKLTTIVGHNMFQMSGTCLKCALATCLVGAGTHSIKQPFPAPSAPVTAESWMLVDSIKLKD